MALIFKNPQGIPEPAANYRHMAIIPPNKRLLILAGQIGNVPVSYTHLTMPTIYSV